MEKSDLTAEVDMLIREATVADFTTIMRHRRGMFYDIGFCDKAALDSMEATSAPFVKSGLEEGSYREWLAEVNGIVAACGVLVIVVIRLLPMIQNLGEHGFSICTPSLSIDVSLRKGHRSNHNRMVSHSWVRIGLSSCE
ncbi:MAG: hypothetical protein EHM14_13735 [Methanothrix sp.]|nr:MAG: hypothetical protein EHM14_13735 [Methanothrix sp.]